MNNVETIKKEIASIAKAGAKLDVRIQKCAVGCLEHMIEHRDHTLLVSLYQALSRGARRASMAAWIMQFSQLTANTGEDKKEKPFILDKEKTADLQGATETMWYDAGKPEQTPDQILDVQKAFRALLNRVAKADKVNVDRAVLVQAAAAFGIPESDVPAKAKAKA